MTTPKQAAHDALDKIDAPDNDDTDRLTEADIAIRAIRQLSPAEQEVLAAAELRRFRDWLNARLGGGK